MQFHLGFCFILILFGCTGIFTQLEVEEEDLTLESQMVIKIMRQLKIEIITEENSLKDTVKKQQEQLEELNKNIIEERTFLTNSITKQREETEDLKKNFVTEILQLKEQINQLKNTIDWVSDKYGPGYRDNTTDIWDALDKASLPAIKYYYRENPEIINKKNAKKWNFSPLHFAARDGQLPIVKYLVKHGANINAIDSDYEGTPLSFACYFGQIKVVSYLIDNKADINFQNNQKQSPLHLAVLNDDFELAKLLIDKGADKTLKNPQNQTPLEYAKYLGERNLIIDYLNSH